MVRKTIASALRIVVALCAVWTSARDGLADDATAKQETVRLVFAGDVMLSDTPGNKVANGVDPFAEFAAVFQQADISVCNLECVISDKGQPVDKNYVFRARPRCIPLLKYHFSALCLANNHTGDHGPEAFLDQLELLKAAKLPYFGGGRNVDEARRPLVLERNGVRVALLGCNDFPPRAFEAQADRPGIAWLREETILADIKAARAEHRADLVIPFLHWGWEMEAGPDQEQKTLARKMIDAGADAVIGGHPHVTQTVEMYNGRPIIYSLGNFVFDYWPADPPVWTSWVVRLTFENRKLADMEMFAAELDDAGLPHLVPRKRVGQ